MIFSGMSETCMLHSSHMILLLLKHISEIRVCSFELAKKVLAYIACLLSTSTNLRDDKV